jgi:hypothetical protein
MTKKADFNAEEWSQILEAPPLAGMIVVAAERGGTLRESVEMSKAYRDARDADMGPELLEEIIESAPEFNPREFGSAEELREKGLQEISEAISILEAKATSDEVDSYRGFVLAVAERVAHAHKSGGFLGFGGHEVSESEQEALDAIAEAMGTVE